MSRETNNPLIVEGGNNPPPPTPLEQAREELADLVLESENWLDGKEIENQAQADAVAKLLDEARKAERRFDGYRKAEKEPHDRAAKAVDAAWKPLLTDAKRIVEIAKAAQTDWLIAQDKAKRERELAAQREAEEKAAAARKLAQEADGSLAAARARDAAIEEAERAEAMARKAAADKAGAKGDGMARTISLRTTWRSVVEDRRALLNHVAAADPDALTGFLEEWAARAVRAGARELPGVTIFAEKVAA